MKVIVMMFAAAKETVGCERVEVEVSDSATVADLNAALRDGYPSLASLLPSCRIAIDDRYSNSDDRVPSGASVALIPPVSGG